ncbi:MAG: hypothetical protein JNJ95_11995 [Dechloromonas sp.]|nr:hypothetical protein [Dechloromonas sp.]
MPPSCAKNSDRYSANVTLGGADDPVCLVPNNVFLNMIKEKRPNLRLLHPKSASSGAR